MSAKPISLTRFLIEEQRAKAQINADLRLLIEVVARACKAHLHRGQQGRAGRRARRCRHRQRPGRGAEEARRAVQRHPARSQRVGRPPGRPGLRGNGPSAPDPARLPEGRLPAAVRSARRLAATSTSTSRSARSSRCCAARTASPSTERRGLPAAGHDAGRAGYTRLRPDHDAGADRRRRHACLHARPRARQLLHDRARTSAIPADTKEFAINMSNQRHWEAPVQALRRRDAGRQGRPARQGLQHALGRLDGGRRAPHPHPRRHLHVPARRARPGPRAASCA